MNVKRVGTHNLYTTSSSEVPLKGIKAIQWYTEIGGTKKTFLYILRYHIHMYAYIYKQYTETRLP